MKSLTLIIAAASLLISFISMPVKAGVEVLSPYTGITWTAGSTEKITWQDNGDAPLLSSLNAMTITLMAGKQNAQFPVAVIASNVQGSSLTESYTVPKDVGPAGAFYFLQFSQGSNLYYSGYFTISGVSGTIANFNPNDPGVPLTTSSASPSSSSTSDTTSTTSGSNSTKVNTATKSKANSSSNLNSLASKTAGTSVTNSVGSTNNPASTQSPVAKSSDGNKLVYNFSALSLSLFFMAFYLF